MDRYANLDRNILPPRIHDTAEGCIAHGKVKLDIAHRFAKKKRYLEAGNSFITAIIQFKVAEMCMMRDGWGWGSKPMIRKLIADTTACYKAVLPLVK